MSIRSISVFKILTYLAQLSIHLFLCYKDFPITYFSKHLCKSTTAWVVKIEMVPIYHNCAHTLWYIYFSILADYINIVKSLHGVTVSPIQNVCTGFLIYISRSFCCSLCKINIFSRKDLCCFIPYQYKIIVLRNTEPSLYRACTCQWMYMAIYL